VKRLCLACGHRYGDIHQACPRCGSKGWMLDREQEPAPETVAPSGPFPMGIAVIAGGFLLLSPVLLIAAIWLFSSPGPGRNAGNEALQVAGLSFLGVLLGALGAGLAARKLWAYHVTLVLLVLDILASLVQGFSEMSHAFVRCALETIALVYMARGTTKEDFIASARGSVSISNEERVQAGKLRGWRRALAVIALGAASGALAGLCMLAVLLFLRGRGAPIGAPMWWRVGPVFIVSILLSTGGRILDGRRVVLAGLLAGAARGILASLGVLVRLEPAVAAAVGAIGDVLMGAAGGIAQRRKRRALGGALGAAAAGLILFLAGYRLGGLDGFYLVLAYLIRGGVLWAFIEAGEAAGGRLGGSPAGSPAPSTPPAAAHDAPAGRV